MSSMSSMLSIEKCISMCASKYNFDAEEALRMIMLCMDNKRKESTNLSLPYNGELNVDLCLGISRNNGLYTQCSSSRKSGEAYCSKCVKQALNNSHGLPDYGTIQQRQSKYNNDEEFVDPSGKKPFSFAKIMKKMKLTEEQVREEALKQGVTIDPRHFEVTSKKSGRPKQEKPVKELKSKGRPKKSKKVLELAGEEEDLFASLVMSSNAVSSVAVSSVAVSSVAVSSVEVSSVEVSSVESVVTEEVENDSSLGDVDVVVLAKTSDKKIKEKKVKEPKVVEKKEPKVKEPKVKETAEEKEQKKKELLEQKALEKEQKKSKVEKKETVKKSIIESNVEKNETKVESNVEEDEEADVVKKITFEGKKYLRSKNSGIIYNMEQDVIGKWNETKQRIDFNPVDDKSDEESEDEYDM